jgi:ATP-dependent DNA helicase RecQ
MDKFEKILYKFWGFKSFRPLQKEIIQEAYNGNDVLGLLPTGGGKSIIFQVAGLARGGLTIVITPLIALMKDQVENLKKTGIEAAALFTGMSREELKFNLQNAVDGKIKFLYISPERLMSHAFRGYLKNMDIGLIAVDEAHCISQWGYDFRPPYLKIAEIRELFPDTPILAVTATATPDVVDDIQEKLKFRKKNIFKKSFERKNLIYIVKETENKLSYLVKTLKKT